MSHRISLLALVALAAATAFASAASAQTREPKPEASTLSIYHDGERHYVALGKVGKKQHAYYGDGKKFYRMVGYAIGSSSNFVVKDPRMRSAELKRTTSGLIAKCQRTINDDATVKLRQLSAKEVSSIARKASFKPPRARRLPHLLARDEMGVYYFVDRLDEQEYRDFRLFVGEAGKITRIALKHVAADTVGQVFATKKGALQVKRTSRELQAYAWVSPSRRSKFELVNVPTKVNTRLIFNTLGVYSGRLGTMCDDL